MTMAMDYCDVGNVRSGSGIGEAIVALGNEDEVAASVIATVC